MTELHHEALERLRRERLIWRRDTCSYIRENLIFLPEYLRQQVAGKSRHGYLGEYSDGLLVHFSKLIYDVKG